MRMIYHHFRQMLAKLIHLAYSKHMRRNPPPAGFESEKAAEAAAYFAAMSGGRIEKMKLIKLLYLSERQCVSEKNRPMFYDRYFSLKDGPICSNALNAINDPEDAVWAQYLEANGNIERSLATDNLEFDHISEFDLRVIGAVWDEFGDMTSSQIRGWTHKNCPEYQEVEEGRVIISLQALADAVGVDSDLLQQNFYHHNSLSSATAK